MYLQPVYPILYDSVSIVVYCTPVQSTSLALHLPFCVVYHPHSLPSSHLPKPQQFSLPPHAPSAPPPLTKSDMANSTTQHSSTSTASTILSHYLLRGWRMLAAACENGCNVMLPTLSLFLMHQQQHSMEI